MTILALLLAAAGVAGAEDEVTIEQTVQVCFACHGVNGASTDPRYPILAGQEEYYLYVQLKDFQSGLRENAEMAPLVAELSRDEMKVLAKYFSQQKWPKLQVATDPDKRKAGTTAAAAGQCPQCHLGGYNGNSRVPRLAGLHPEYLRKTMMDFKTRARKNSPAKNSLLDAFSAEDIEAMAHFLGSLTVYERSSGSEIK